MNTDSIFTDIDLFGAEEETERIPPRQSKPGSGGKPPEKQTARGTEKSSTQTGGNETKISREEAKMSPNQATASIDQSEHGIKAFQRLINDKFYINQKDNFSGIGASVDSGYSTYAANRERSRKYFKDLKKNANAGGERASFYAFKPSSQPVYSDMNSNQSKYYFYWRDQLRKGNFITTDLGYIKLLANEIINGIGWEDPEEAFNLLYKIMNYYSKDFSNLYNILGNLIIDFCFDQDRLDLLKKLENDYNPSTDIFLDALVSNHETDKTLRMPFHIISALCNYDVTTSKLYPSKQKVLEIVMPEVLRAVDAKLKKENNGKGILRLYGPKRSKSYEKNLYPSALYPPNKRIKYVPLKGYSNSSKLNEFISGVLRQTENALRQAHKIKGRLRINGVDKPTQEFITSFIKKRYNPNESNPEKAFIKEAAKKEKIALNPEEIKSVRKESNAVREALEVKDANSDVISIKPTDLAQLLRSLSPEGKNLILTLEKSGWSADLQTSLENELKEVNRKARENFTIPLVIITDGKMNLNPKYLQPMTYIMKELRDTIGFKEGRESEEGLNLAGIPIELKDLLEDLTDIQIKVLKTILTEDNPAAALEEIANESFTMSELLIDELNDEAMVYLDDILVENFDDMPVVLDEYQTDLKHAFGIE